MAQEQSLFENPFSMLRQGSSAPLSDLPLPTIYCDARDTSASVQISHPQNTNVGRILLVRDILHRNFALPTEIISMILDHAALWASTTYSITRDDSEYFIGYYKIITTSPLGCNMTACTKNEEARALLRGPNPCRRIRTKAWVKLQGISGRSRCPCSEYSRPFTMHVIWPDYDDHSLYVPNDKLSSQVFQTSNLQFVRRPSVIRWPKEQKSAHWSLDVIDSVRTQDVIEERETVWDWAQKGPGGDLIRCLQVGDALQIRTGRQMHAAAIKIPRIEIEIFYAV